MFDLEGCIDEQLRASDRPKPTLIFPEADDGRVVTAASHLVPFANIVLMAPKARIEELLEQDIPLQGSVRRLMDRVRIIDPNGDRIGDEDRGAVAAQMHELSKGHRWEMTVDKAADLLADPVHQAIMLVRNGYADAVLGGLAHATRDFLRPCLRLLPREGTVYEMGLFALPDDHPVGVYQNNLVMFADVALNPEPSTRSLADIAVGACKAMRDLIPVDVLPEVNGAVISYSTKGSGEGPSVERIRGAEPLIQAMLHSLRKENPLYETIAIETELQASVALSEVAARTKLDEPLEFHPAAGRSSVLIVPSLDVGNILFHLYSTRFPDALPVLIIGGMGSRALDFSRSSSAQSVVLGTKALILRLFRSGRYTRTPNDFFFPRYKVFAINPGSTSTKLALFEGDELVKRAEVIHDQKELQACDTLMGQLPMRLQAAKKFLAGCNTEVQDLDVLVARGGLLLPVPSGTYNIDNQMLDDLEREVGGSHASNLGARIGQALAHETSIPSYIVDPPVVDELDGTSTITGLKESEQEAAWHALSQKAAAKRYAEKHGTDYEDLNLIVAHLGGGISVGAHRKGRCVRVKNALYDGPMSPNRAGTLPGYDLIDLCYSGLSRSDLESMLIGKGGLYSYLGTSDLREVQRRIDDGDEKARLVLEAMCEQIAAEIASNVPKFKGEQIHRIIITGGMTRSERLRAALARDLSRLRIPLTFYPGEHEMEALRDGALRVLRGQEEARDYRPLRDHL